MSAIRPIRWTGAQRSSYLLLVAPGLLVAIDSSVLLLAIPSLNTALKPTAAESIWINDIYGFMVAAFMIPAGRLADRVGRKRLLLIASGLFAGASVVAAFSASATMLIVARGTIGIAASAIIPCCIAVIRDVFADERQRSVAMGMWTAFFAVGVAVGPLIGGLLLQSFSCGSVFLIVVPVAALVILLGPRFIPDDAVRARRPMDLLSIASLVLGILAVMYGVKAELTTNPTLWALLVLVIGIGSLAGFVIRQLTRDEPLLDLRVLGRPEVAPLLVALFVTALIMGGVQPLLTTYLQTVQGLTPEVAAMWLLPQTAIIVVVSPVGALLAARIGARALIPGGIAVMSVGLTVMAQTQDRNGALVLVAGYSIAVAGMGAIYAVLMNTVVGSVPPRLSGITAATAQTANELGIAVGVAVLGIVTAVGYRDAVARTGLAHRLPPTVTVALAEHARTAGRLADVVFAAFAGALRVNSYACAAVLAVLSVLVAASLRRGAATAAV